MSEVFKPIFTDAIKDVIGNDPVLDQFDTYYAANFYGTLQDSYITGAMLYDVTKSTPGITSKVFVTGTRGKAFNKLDANSQPPLNDAYGSTEVNQVPNLSYRLVPWKDRISNTYRSNQCFDSQERYYDSCLPDLNDAFAVDGANVWTISDDAAFLLSPYANVQSSSIGYMIFNGVKSDRSSQGLTNDPFVNNSWTWSYPYENKYSPQNRKVEIRDLFPQASISTTAASFSETPDAKSTYEAINQSLINKSLLYQGYEEVLFGFEVFTRNTLPKVQPSFEEINVLSQPKSINSFIPLLPGKHEPQILGSTGRNSLRYFVNVTGTLGAVSIPTTVQENSRLDQKFGISTLIPTDVKLDSKISHAYLPSSISVPPPEFLTSSMTYADTVRFLFGFGDLNNVAYGNYSLIKENVTSSYMEGFESYSNGTRAYNISNYTSDPDLNVRWSVSTTSETPPQTWQVISASSLAFYPGETNAVADYYYVSGSLTSGNKLTSGLAWNSSSLGKKILMTSGTADLFGGGGFDPASGAADSTIASVDITSSYPWTLSYYRAVAGHTSDGLFVYFSAVPGIDNDFSSLGLPMLPLEFVRGKASTANTDTLVKMEKFDLRTSVSSDTYPPYIQGFVGKTSGSIYDYPLPPGNWRLNFAYLKSGSTTDALVANQDVAAIDNFEIFTWRENAFQPISTVGANNYPEFRSIKLDSRYNPIAPGYTKNYIRTVVTGSADLYKGLAFGVSPIIRGWKYGLHSGFPTYSKSIFRRDKFGQFRDMLEQRQYTKFINVDASPIDEDATMKGIKIKEREESDTINVFGNALSVEKSPVEVSFVRRRYEANDRNIGRIYAQVVTPELTTSQNLSTEVTSSLPYFDGVARHRTESSIPNLRTT